MRTHLAEILVEQYDLNEDALAEARRLREEKGGRIGDILVQQNNISEKQLLEALSIQYDMPYWPKLPLENAESGFTDKVPIQFLKKYNMVPLEYLDPITAANRFRDGALRNQRIAADTHAYMTNSILPPLPKCRVLPCMTAIDSANPVMSPTSQVAGMSNSAPR